MVVALADRHPATAVGDVVQVQRQHLARPQPAVQHQQEHCQIPKPLQTADELLQHRLVHRTRQPPRLPDRHRATRRLLTARAAHERPMPVRHPSKCRVKALLHRRAAVVLLGDHRPVVEAGNGGQDPVHRRRGEQTARRRRAADHHRQAQPLGRPPRRCPPQERQQPQGIRAPKLAPVHALSSEEGEQAAQVVGVRADRVRRETSVDQMIQEPAGRRDRLTSAVDQPHSAYDTAIAFLDHPHTGLPDLHSDGPTRPAPSPPRRRFRHHSMVSR